MSGGTKANRGPTAAAENRRAIIAAARTVFERDGYDAPLSAVSRLAEVGQGSLYRHFPDRVALAVAVFAANVDELERIADDPGGSLDDLFSRVVEQMLVSPALVAMVAADGHDPRARELETRVRAVTARLVDRERAAGRVGDGVTGDDAYLAITLLAGRLPRQDAAGRRRVAERALAIVRAGFAPGAPLARPSWDEPGVRA